MADDMGTKHTPQWTIGNKSQFATHNPSMIYDANGDAVAQVYGVPLHTTLKDAQADPRWAEGLKRARLIAAAPELLAALKAAWEGVSDKQRADLNDPRLVPMDVTSIPVLYGTLRKIESAIRAAEGE